MRIGKPGSKGRPCSNGTQKPIQHVQTKANVGWVLMSRAQCWPLLLCLLCARPVARLSGSCSLMRADQCLDCCLAHGMLSGTGYT